jgi:hypothetical protein
VVIVVRPFGRPWLLWNSLPFPCSVPGPRHQFANYWREGEFDGCRSRLRELLFCLEFKRAKGQRLREMAGELLRAGESTTEGTIWTARDRDKPGIDFGRKRT